MPIARHPARSLAKDDRGVAAIEYALLCALIAVAAVGGIKGLGGSVGAYWDAIEQAVADAAGDEGPNGQSSGHGNGNTNGKGEGQGNGNGNGNNGNGRGNNG
mgnify:CR=1 FL=1